MHVIYQDANGSKELIKIPPAYKTKRRKNKRLSMSTRRYSKRRMGRRAYALKRLKDLGIQKIVNEFSGQEQCKMETEIVVEGDFETEQSFAKSISVIFDELEKIDLRKSDGETKGLRTLSAQKVQVAQTAASWLFLEDNKMIVERIGPSSTSNKLQRKVANKFSMSLNCEAEKDFSASISEMFDELEKINILTSDCKTKGLCALSALQDRVAQNAASRLFLEDGKMIVERTALSPNSNEQQCKIENKFSVLLNCEAEKDFSASVSLAFDVLQEIDKIEEDAC